MVKNKENPKVTVVMAVYKEKEIHLRNAVESILCQTMSDFEFVIILDSPKNVVLKNVLEEYACSDDRITIYLNEKNLGPSISRNKGIMFARAEYVAVMDGDDVSKPYRLERQLYKIQQEQLDIVGGYVDVIGDDGEVLYSMDHLPLIHENIAKKMKINNCIPHSTCFVRKEVYQALNGYADILCEDYDFLLRAIRAGYKMGTVNEILLEYRLSEKSLSRNNLYKQYLMMQYLQDKYYVHRYNYQSYEQVYKKKYSEERAQKYAKASIYFEDSLKYKKNRNYFKMLFSMFRVLVSSKEYCMKILRYVIENNGMI